ncbi:MAG: acyl carrier protein [Candidatus Zixiibacteriota bacterium]|nr:MAG: acyl carrier protein [candidate division Zixibacteria bacterium]
MSPNEKILLNLLIEILLIDEDQFKDDYGPNEIETWDSLASVGIAAAVEKEFGYAMSPEEMALMDSIGDIKNYLRSGGIDF